jgi:hypothetical protein
MKAEGFDYPSSFRFPRSLLADDASVPRNQTPLTSSLRRHFIHTVALAR